MGTKQVDNSAVTATSTDNEGSAILGLNTDRNNAKKVDLGQAANIVGGPFYGSRVTIDMPAVTSGVNASVAQNNDRGVILQVTDTLGGTTTKPASFIRLGGASEFDETTHKVESITINTRTSGIRAGKWNAFSGEFTSANNNVTMALGTDCGVLTCGPTFQFGSNTPKQSDYEAKTT